MRHTLTETLSGLRRNASMNFAVVVTMWVSLSLFGIGLLAAQQVDLIKGRWYDKIEISVFLCAPKSQAPTCEPGQSTTPAQRDAIEATLREILASPWEAVRLIVPDGLESVRDAIVRLVDQEGCDLVLTTGGTGPAPRDVTPEATEAACEKMLPGFGELMRRKSLEQVPTAILSRQTAGIRGQALVINLPGKPSSIRVMLLAVFPAVPYCLDLIGGHLTEINVTSPTCLVEIAQQQGFDVAALVIDKLEQACA